jgi:hypothetical protein
MHVYEVQRIGGPGWDPLFACLSHTTFEIEVWKVKTNRRSYERDRKQGSTDLPEGSEIPR